MTRTQTHRTAQKLAEHQDETVIQKKKTVFVFVFQYTLVVAQW